MGFRWAIFLSIGCLGVLFGCGTTSPVTATLPSGTEPASRTPPSAGSPTSRLTPSPSATVSPSPSPTLTPTPSWPEANQRHDLEVTYAPYWQRLVVQHRLRYTNTTGETLERLPLLAPALTQSFITLETVEAPGRTLTFTWDWKRWLLWLTIDPPLKPNETLDLRLQYLLGLRPLRTTPEDLTKPMAQGYTQLQTNGVEWHFLVAAYHPRQGWLLPQVWPFGEFMAYPIGDYTVRLQFPQGWQVAHNGQAIPCPERSEASGMLQVCFQVRRARQAVFSLSPVYEKRVQEVPSRRGSPVQVEAYLFAGDRDKGDLLLEVLRQALTLFEDYYGPYHRERMVFVVGDFPFSMEYDGIFFVRRSFFFDDPQERLTAVTVHEVAHQWWYAQVHNDPGRGPWMDESLSAYSEVLYYQTYLPQRLTWWWTAYWEGLEPGQGPIDRPLWEYWDYFDYRSLAYLKGATLWQEIHEALGDEGFRALMHRYVQAYRGRVVLPEELKAFLADQLPPDLWGRIQDAYFTP